MANDLVWPRIAGISSKGFTHPAGTFTPTGPSAIPGGILNLYGSGLLDGSVIPPQVSMGGRLAEILWFDNAPRYPGVNDIDMRVPVAPTPGRAVPVWPNYLDRLSNSVSKGGGKP